MTNVDAPFLVNLDDLDLDLVTDLYNILDVLYAMFCKLRDMTKPFLARQEFHKCAELQETCDTSRIDLANLNLAHDVLNHLAGAIHCLHIRGRDEDISILMNIDIDARFINDLTDDLAAGSNDIADLINVNGDDLHARCMW